jgi:hypothetical protein
MNVNCADNISTDLMDLAFQYNYRAK